MISDENKEVSLEDEPMIEPVKEKEPVKKGPVVLLGVAIACLLVVVLSILIVVFMSPKATSLPTFVDTKPQTEVLEETYVDETLVEGRDPDVLGLTIDTLIGRYFTERESGKALYVNTSGEECADNCLNDWAPYITTEAMPEGSLLGTVEKEDGTLQYTWNGLGLYTYNEDNVDTLLGDGYEGTWEIARP